MSHDERHRSHHNHWLRAAVLGANDGIISTASLMIGFAAANAAHESIILSGLAGLIAGAMSMAAGEYVSVSTQADTEAADLAVERLELANDYEHELTELTHIYIHRGLKPELAHEVAVQLTAHDALGAHARDELGITEFASARPMQAAFTSAAAFSLGALVPLIVTLFSQPTIISYSVGITSLVSLAFLGGLAAKVGGANIYIGVARVTFWGILAMVATAVIGHLFGVITV